MNRADIPAAIRQIRQRVYDQARDERLSVAEIQQAESIAIHNLIIELQHQGQFDLADVVKQLYGGPTHGPQETGR